jgi:hypothetical protein
MTILHVEFYDSHRILTGSIEKKDDAEHHKCVYVDAVINKGVHETTCLSIQYNPPEMMVAKEWVLQHKSHSILLLGCKKQLTEHGTMVLPPSQIIIPKISHCRNSTSFHG